MKIGHILVATDLSAESARCIPSVAELARSVNARITLLHVVESHEAIAHGSPLSPPIREPKSPEAIAVARAQLEERRAAYGDGLEIHMELVPGGDAAREITAYADAHNVDLIAMASHGRTGFRRLVIGSVAEAVVRQSRVPVLVLPRPKG